MQFNPKLESALMNQMTQGEAVFQAVSAVVDVNGAVELSEAQKREVHAIVLDYFLTGQTSHSRNPGKDELKKYIPGLVNNWIRKDPRLNGGRKYETKNPGSRTGSGDEPLKAMKALLASTDDPEAKAEILRAIENRKAELTPKKVINVAALPPELVKFVPTK